MNSLQGQLRNSATRRVPGGNLSWGVESGVTELWNYTGCSPHIKSNQGAI